LLVNHLDCQGITILSNSTDDALASFPADHIVTIGTLASYAMNLNRHYRAWDISSIPWFRGEPGSVQQPLHPKLYRPRTDGSQHDENLIIQDFRRMAPAVGQGQIPARSDTDQWLFLMQHTGAPTRLLDWTEGALIGLFFALQFEDPVVWMLNPVGLNRLTAPDYPDMNVYPLTWFRPEGSINIGSVNVAAAWEHDQGGTELPVAIKPTYIHPRMSAQKSCFTVWGSNKGPLHEIVPSDILRMYRIRRNSIGRMTRELRVMGITRSSLFPELDGLAEELGERPS
jgi:hypothetical protein